MNYHPRKAFDKWKKLGSLSIQDIIIKANTMGDKVNEDELFGSPFLERKERDDVYLGLL